MFTKLKRILMAILLVAPLMLNPVAAFAATTVSITSPSSSSTVTGTSFTVSGIATADRLITVDVNGTEVGTTISDGSGNWSLSVSGQAAGIKTVTATASVQYAYVANGNAATLSVVNTVTDEVVNTVSTTTNQGGAVAVSPDGSQLVTVSGYGGDGTIRVFSLANPESPVITNNLTAPDSYPVNVVYSPSGTYFVISSVESDFSSSTVTRYTSASPGTSSAVTGYDQVFPAGLAYNSDSTRLYVSNVISGSLSVINATTNTQLSTFSTGGATFAGYLVLASDDNTAYISSTNQDAAIPVNISGTSAGSSISIGDQPFGLTLNQDDSRLIVANGTSNSLSMINTSSNTVVDTISTGGSTAPRVPLFNSDYSKLYVTYFGTDQLGVLNPTTLATESTITVGDAPYGLALGPVESSSASVNFTFSGASSLAGTGQSTYLYYLIAGTLLTVSAGYLIKRYKK